MADQPAEDAAGQPGDGSAREEEEDDTPMLSPRGPSVQKGLLAEAVNNMDSADVAAAMQHGVAGSDWGEDSDWDYELDNIVDINIRKLIRAELRQSLRKVIARQQRPATTLMRDKLTFVLGTLDLYLSAYWLGAWPDTFYRLYTVKAAVLFCIRWVVYRYKKWHYYLFDLCYAAQLLLLLQLWAFPTNITLVKMTFAMNLGPLIWSIVAFRNSLVYHSLDKMTSHFLHWFPACVSYATRWHPRAVMLDHLTQDAAARLEWESASFTSLFLLPLLPYLAWVVLYYLKVFVISNSRIEQRGYETLFKFATASKKSLFGAVVLRFPRKLQPLVYMLMHVALSCATLTFTALWWRYRWACEMFLVAQFTASAWSGATFYFDVFSRRYIAGLSASSARGSAVSLAEEQAREASRS